MSQFFYIFNKDTKQFYRLGQACWWKLQDMRIFYDRECLELYMHEDIFRLDKNSDHYKWLIDNIERVSNELVKFAGSSSPESLMIYDDSGDELYVAKVLGFKCVGSLYEDDRYLLNEHLTDDRYARTRQDLADFAYGDIVQKFMSFSQNDGNLIDKINRLSDEKISVMSQIEQLTHKVDSINAEIRKTLSEIESNPSYKSK